MYLLKLQMHKYGNSIYFTCDNMVCFPKSGHIYKSMCPFLPVAYIAGTQNVTGASFIAVSCITRRHIGSKNMYICMKIMEMCASCIIG